MLFRVMWRRHHIVGRSSCINICTVSKEKVILGMNTLQPGAGFATGGHFRPRASERICAQSRVRPRRGRDGPGAGNGALAGPIPELAEPSGIGGSGLVAGRAGRTGLVVSREKRRGWRDRSAAVKKERGRLTPPPSGAWPPKASRVRTRYRSPRQFPKSYRSDRCRYERCSGQPWHRARCPGRGRNDR